MLIDKKSPHGGDIYANRVSLDFSANINPYGMPDEIRGALHEAVDGSTRYPDPYCTALRDSLAGYERVPAEDLICGNGAAELIYQFAYSLPGDKPALIISPTFCEYEAALPRAERYYLKADGGFVLTRDILSVNPSAYSSVFICSPNNPTGLTVETGLLYELADKCRDAGTRLFCDLCFLDLADTPEMYDIPRLTGEYPNVFVLRAFTKSFALAGVRLGWGICRDKKFLSEMCRRVQCWNVSAFAQAAGGAAVGCGGWLENTKLKIRAERERMKTALDGLGVRVLPGEANYLLLHSEVPLYRRLAERKILVRDCSDYAGLSAGYVRTAVKTYEENNLLIENIEDIIHEKS